MAYRVREQTREIGIRLALGAPAETVLRTVLGRGLALTLVGLMAGLALAFMTTRVLESFLFGVSATDPLAYAAAAAVLLAAAALACLIPALRAARVDPVVALRTE